MAVSTCGDSATNLMLGRENLLPEGYPLETLNESFVGIPGQVIKREKLETENSSF